jgi:hypothetical protein
MRGESQEELRRRLEEDDAINRSYNFGAPWAPFTGPVSLAGCFTLIWVLAIIVVVVAVFRVV